MSRPVYHVRRFEEALDAKVAAQYSEEREDRAARYEKQPIAQFFDGLTYIDKRSDDTFNSSGRKQKVFENRREIIGDGAARYSTQGSILLGIRPELVREHEMEDMLN